MAPTTTDHDSPGERERADVTLRLPAEGAYAAVVRTTAAGLAARLDFAIDDIEDLRIAIGEALALALSEADPGTDLDCRFHLSPGTMTVELCVEAVDEPALDTDSFAWQVLETMADQARAASDQGQFRVEFSVSSHLS